MILSFATIKKLSGLFVKEDEASEDFEYLTHAQLDELFKHVGFNMNVNEAGGSRAVRMSRSLTENNELYSLGNLFTEIIKLAELKNPFNSVLAQINNCINIDGYKIIKDKTRYILLESTNIVNFNELNNFDKIKSEHKYLIDRLNNDDHNGVYTRARTMIEKVFDELYTKNTGNTFEKDKQFLDKWGWVKRLGLNLVPANHENPAVRNLAQSFGTIIENINQLRNGGSDAHSNTSVVELPKHHVELLINSAVTLSLFLLSSGEFQNRLKGKTDA